MSAINELKYRFFSGELGETGTLSYLERKWLQVQTGEEGTINELWMKYLGGMGYTGTFNDRFTKWLRGQGYSGATDQMYYRWLLNAGFPAEAYDFVAVADFNQDRYALPAMGDELLVAGIRTTGVAGAATAVVNGDESVTLTGDGTNVAYVEYAIPSTPGDLIYFEFEVGGALAYRIGTTTNGTDLQGSTTVNSASVRIGVTARSATTYLRANKSAAAGATIRKIGAGAGPSARKAILDRVAEIWGSNLGGSGYTMSVAGGTSTATESPSGQLNLTGDNSNLAIGDKGFATDIGARYRVEFDVDASGVGRFLGIAQADGSTVPSAGAPQGRSFIDFIATSTTTWIRFAKQTTGLARVTNISIRKVPAVRGAYPKRPATFAEFFAFTASSTVARSYVAADGTWKNDLAADAPRFDWRNGKRQLRLEDETTRLNTDFPANRGATGATSTALPAEGLFNPARSISQGQTWHRTRTSLFAVTSGTTVNWRARYRAGTSGQCGIYLDSGAGQTVVSGAPGALAVGSTAGGAVTILSQVVLTNGDHEITGTWTPNATGASANLGIGPNSANVGEYIDMLGAQVCSGTVVSDWIFGLNSSVTRAIETARFSPLVEAIIQRPAATEVARGINEVNNSRIIGIDSNRYLINRRNYNGNSASWNGSAEIIANRANSDSWDTGAGAAHAHDSAGRSVAMGGGIGTDTNQPASRAASYLGRSATSGAGSPYGTGLYDFVGISPERLTNSRLQEMAVAA